MPSRLIREGLLSSDKVHAVGEAAEVLFVRLMLAADDFGRFDGRVSVIRSTCWPLATDAEGPNGKEVFDRLILLIRHDLVVSYEVDGKPFIFIPNFAQRLRAKRSKYPAPPDHPTQVYPQTPDIPPSHDRHATGTQRPEVEVEVEVESEVEAQAEVKAAPLPVDNVKHDVPRETGQTISSIVPPGDEVKIEAEDETPAGIIAAVLRRNDIVANAFHPLVQEWAREGVNVEQVRTAIATARQRKPKPERIPMAYLDPILADIRAGTMRKTAPAWRSDDNAAEAFARELGIRGAKIGEDRTAFHKRIEQALADKSRRNVA